MIIDNILKEQIEKALGELPEPKEGQHYVAEVGDIVYNPDTNEWSYEMNFSLKDRESEDERIRKFIKDELMCLRVGEKDSDRDKELLNAIAWLEKQKEQKPVDPSDDELGAILKKGLE